MSHMVWGHSGWGWGIGVWPEDVDWAHPTGTLHATHGHSTRVRACKRQAAPDKHGHLATHFMYKGGLAR